MGNPTAGIILLLGSAVLITLGVTNKGKKIISVLLGTDEKSDSSSNEQSKPPVDISRNNPDISSGGVTKNDIIMPGALHASYPGAFVGEKGAKPT